MSALLEVRDLRLQFGGVKAVDGLSFGYRAREYKRTAAGRVLEDVDLFEISLVTHPLQPGARVHMVR